MLTRLSVSNAVLSENIQLALMVYEENFAPRVTITLEQNDVPISVIDGGNGEVTATVNITDVNQNDTYSVTWSLDGVNEFSDNEVFTFDPSLMVGVYSLEVLVEENNTSEQFSVSIDKTVLIKTTLEMLSGTVDSDGDGISDADEGYSDTDNDGIVDFLDDNTVISLLPVNDEIEPLQTLSHLHLSLGDIALANNDVMSNGAGVTTEDIATYLGNLQLDDNSSDELFEAITPLINFNVSGLTQSGDSVPVIIELAEGVTIPQGAVYRKYNVESGWFDFVVDSKNTLSSAYSDVNGNCPTPLSSDYQQGLNDGDNCLQLLIEDGGANDSDGSANGIIKDPGVLAKVASNDAPVISLASSMSADENSNVAIIASATDDENDALTYLWQQTSGDAVNITNVDSATLNFVAPNVGTSGSTLSFELTVSDGVSDSVASIDITIENVNQAPTVSILALSAYDEGEIVTITSNVADVDNDNVTYLWSQSTGPNVTLTDVTSSSIIFTAPNVSADADITLSLIVNDGYVDTRDTVTIEVKNVPVVTTPTPENDSSGGGGGGSMGWSLLLLGFTLISRRAYFKKAV